MAAVLHYFHDPMCSWCWGYRPTWLQLRAALPANIVVRNVLGGLAPDNDQPMPTELQATIRSHWRRIASELGTEFNFDFWTQCKPRRSTYPACRAVLAASAQDREEDMIHAIQRAYYLRAMNPSDQDTLVGLANELNLDVAKFCADLDSVRIQETLLQHIALARGWRVPGFPSLVLLAGEKKFSITLDYQRHQTSLDSILLHLDSA
jgi:putative protein-disulfide isomerase